MKRFFVVVCMIFATCLTVVGTLLARWDYTAQAEQKNPFFVSAKDFEVDGIVLTQSKFIITLKYIGKKTDGLPQYGTSLYDASALEIQTDDDDVLNVEKFAPVNNDAYRISLQFSLRSTDSSTLGFQDAAPTKLSIPVGTVIGLSTEYKENVGKYTSLNFTSSLVLEKYTADDHTESWRCVATERYERYYVDLNKTETFKGAFRDENNQLYALFTVPYLATEDAVYDGTITCFCGTNYQSTPVITQEKGTKTVRITFPNSEALKGNMGDATLSLHGGELTDENLGIQLIVSGERTLYAYADGIFSEEKRIEIRILDETYYTVYTVEGTKKSLVLPKRNGKVGKIFYGWMICGEKYQESEEIALSPFTATGLDVVAEYIDCQLINGAWICADEETGKVGIRFQVALSNDSFEKYSKNVVGLGVIVMPSSFIESDREFTLQNYDRNAVQNFYAGRRNMRLENGAYTVNASIYNIDEANANVAYLARGYLVMNFGGENLYFWCDGMLERTPCGLANSALGDKQADINEETKRIFSVYANAN